MGAAHQQVLQADKDRFSAMIKVDEATLNKLLSDEVVYTHSTGTDKNLKIRYTEVHTKSSGSWQLLAWQSTVIPQ